MRPESWFESHFISPPHLHLSKHHEKAESTRREKKKQPVLKPDLTDPGLRGGSPRAPRCLPQPRRTSPHPSRAERSQACVSTSPPHLEFVWEGQRNVLLFPQGCVSADLTREQEQQHPRLPAHHPAERARRRVPQVPVGRTRQPPALQRPPRPGKAPKLRHSCPNPSVSSIA